MILRDHNGRHAIVVRQTPRAVRVVVLDSGMLTVTRLTDEQLADRAFRTIDYPLERAVAVFLKHAGGVSDAARRELLKLVEPKLEGRVSP